MNTKKQESSLNILLVEDYTLLATLVEHIASYVAPSCKVTCVQNGEKAVREIQRQREYCAIIMNYSMPVMNGIEATQRIRALGYDGPIIGWSAYTKEEKAHECLAAGMDMYVEKSGNLKPIMEVFKAIHDGTLMTFLKQGQR